MRLIVASLPFVLLAACNGSGADNKAADPAANAAAPEAAANGSMSAANTAAAMDPARAGEINECIEDVRTEVPEGTDLNAFCGCAVDRMRGTGAGERQAMEACAAEMGIQPR